MSKELTHKSALKQGLIVNKIEYRDEKSLIVTKEMKIYKKEESNYY
ncbi:hypothetical protein H9661_18335, partial [Clostridium sp. Sa3CVN1]|nr:hypothetical protein [Clostridium cibarium]